MKRGGFSLLEVLLAVLLLGTGLAVLIQIVNAGLFAGSINEDEVIASNFIQEEVETLRNTAYSGISDVAKAAVTGFPAFKRQVTVTTPQANLKKISVTVYWYAGSTETYKNMVTYASDI